MLLKIKHFVIVKTNMPKNVHGGNYMNKSCKSVWGGGVGIDSTLLKALSDQKYNRFRVIHKG